jgi:predicted SnoaL-like aldol condensation-catalyzing enzyme
MNTQQAKRFFDNLYREIWQEGRIEKFPYYYHEDVLVTLGNYSLNYSQIKERILQQQKIGKKMSYRIVDIIAERDLVALHIDVYDYLEKNLKIMGFFHFKEGKIHDVTTVSSLITPA